MKREDSETQLWEFLFQRIHGPASYSGVLAPCPPIVPVSGIGTAAAVAAASFSRRVCTLQHPSAVSSQSTRYRLNQAPKTLSEARGWASLNIGCLSPSVLHNIVRPLPDGRCGLGSAARAFVLYSSLGTPVLVHAELAARAIVCSGR